GADLPALQHPAGSIRLDCRHDALIRPTADRAVKDKSPAGMMSRAGLLRQVRQDVYLSPAHGQEPPDS
ncbi:hypothetical protein NPJ88_019200, partial [Halomonas elongata]|uniref:hypothetical protein n=1 Tax=Halomonas elongata TaxID=2746 RepID=UPI00255B22D7